MMFCELYNFVRVFYSASQYTCNAKRCNNHNKSVCLSVSLSVCAELAAAIESYYQQQQVLS